MGMKPKLFTTNSLALVKASDNNNTVYR